MLDHPALEPLVERDHFVPTVTVTVFGASGTGRSVLCVVRSPPGFGLSFNA
jgi:hypothetical protein